MNRSWIGCMAVVVAVGSMVVQLGPCALAAGSSVSEAKATDLVSLDIRDVDIRSAVQALFKTAGKNYAIDPNVSGTVTAISIRDAAFDVALKSLAKANGLAWRVENDVYIISKKAEVAASAPPSSVPYADPDTEIDVVSSEETIIDKVPLNYSSASEILAAMNGDTSRLYGGLNGNTGFGNMGMYGNNLNNGGYGGYGGYGIGNVNIGGFGGYGGYGGGNYGNYGGYGGFGGYGGYGNGAYQNPIRHR